MIINLLTFSYTWVMKIYYNIHVLIFPAFAQDNGVY